MYLLASCLTTRFTDNLANVAVWGTRHYTETLGCGCSGGVKNWCLLPLLRPLSVPQACNQLLCWSKTEATHREKIIWESILLEAGTKASPALLKDVALPVGSSENIAPPLWLCSGRYSKVQNTGKTSHSPKGELRESVLIKSRQSSRNKVT